MTRIASWGSARRPHKGASFTSRAPAFRSSRAIMVKNPELSFEAAPMYATAELSVSACFSAPCRRGSGPRRIMEDPPPARRWTGFTIDDLRLTIDNLDTDPSFDIEIKSIIGEWPQPHESNRQSLIVNRKLGNAASPEGTCLRLPAEGNAPVPLPFPPDFQEAPGLPLVRHEAQIASAVVRDHKAQLHAAWRILIETIIVNSIHFCDYAIHLGVSNNPVSGRKESADEPPFY